MHRVKENMANWFGSVCLRLSFGSVSIGSSLKLTGGTLSSGKPSKTGSPADEEAKQVRLLTNTAIQNQHL
ncbi:hypothetical protein V6N11_020718 [Hibiscus sabdariffa]|uniref:Uncharacterized protein n=1 Tax=Hibiscus sabdariffa TaxID=183260 RepID=A0ABR2Q9L9_9ROSI